MSLKHITNKKYTRRVRASLKGGSVSEGPHNFISLGVPKGHNPALDITINISSLYLMNILNPYKVTSVHLYMYIMSHIPFLVHLDQRSM